MRDASGHLPCFGRATFPPVLFFLLAFLACADDRNSPLVRYEQTPSALVRDWVKGKTKCHSVRVQHDNVGDSVCGQLQLHNCTLSYTQLQCPHACPFRAPHPEDPCKFWCVERDACSSRNPVMALSNLKTGMCEKCILQFCQVCEDDSTCKQCFDGFILNGEGACEFYLSVGLANQIVLCTAYVLLALMVLIIAIGMIYAAYNLNPLDAETRFINFEAIAYGRRLRHLKKVVKWNFRDFLQPIERYNLLCDVHHKNILGVGLALYYNSIVFVLLICAASYFIVRRVVVSSHLLDDLPAAHVNLEQWRWKHASEIEGLQGVEVMTPLELCGNKTLSSLDSELEALGYEQLKAVSMLYLFVFLTSVAFAYWQKRAAAEFDSRNVSMADYVVRLDGLPDDDIHEPDLAAWFEAECVRLGMSEISINGVSICYNYKYAAGRFDLVQDMLTRIERVAERSLGTEAFLHSQGMGDEKFDRHKDLDLHVQGDSDKFVAWFYGTDGSGGIKSSGTAFIVFHRPSHRAEFLKAYGESQIALSGKSPLRRNDVSVSAHQTFAEPPEMMWEDFEVTPAHFRRNYWIAILKVAIVFVLIQIPVLAYNYYIVLPYAGAGAASGGLINMLSGVLLGIINGQLGGQVWGAAFGVGFHNQNDAMMFILVVNVVTNLVNTVIAISAAVHMQVHVGGGTPVLYPIQDAHGIGPEMLIARVVYYMLMPGQLFVGQLVGMFMGNVLPAVQHAFVQKVIFYWRCLPDPLLKALQPILPWCPGGDMRRYPRFNAEMCYQANPVGLAWDSVPLIINMCIAFSVLGLLSPSTSDIFRCMCFWAVFYYFISRYTHLRIASNSLHASHKVDATLWAVWCFPLGALAAAVAVWTMRCGLIFDDRVGDVPRIMFLLLAFALSSCLWHLCFTYLVNPWHRNVEAEDEDITYEDYKAERAYTWYNCNPIFVLKSQYLLGEDASGKRMMRDETGQFRLPFEHCRVPLQQGQAIRYQVGKEYLFLSKETQAALEKALHSESEFETYLERFFGFLHKATTCVRPQGTGYLEISSVQAEDRRRLLA
eukprot:TRINITY_DN64781_c0_g1_i1.p1 TRINITY_DN64781_c0_g1~~TRINITY_DN64781_c0_g1_i1.p1  ORF type:complete len:1052 (+),score=97.89 TRINITY_DN64781_c0_g1_i1:54-3209(+)